MKKLCAILCLLLLPTASMAKSPAVIASINAKLARWVHPSGKCSGQEWMTTYYWSGSHTSSGERFNSNGHTAAHRHLAFGTVLRVCNPHNGRCVSVRINDRGPFTHASLDLARGAARAIGMNTSMYLCID